jgi:hypothetical protein
MTALTSNQTNIEYMGVIFLNAMAKVTSRKHPVKKKLPHIPYSSSVEAHYNNGRIFWI